ncbi:aldo/keto reductase [Janthinobacterium agaricidamnosum]|uniref:Aldo/keto reductase family protein n=1 Tax=Janthinobacterium agaricidamnosum NBRC 102515 = DSM 9628 TaxID=1349767 RepID=W0V2L3_9BURK|nr:aldo/keto reductase [Janthinobacterium agaricidamnosum]CDG81588.1 aldo/keto reductase family protein [Janthinobacterium agaricidamnosum NBRC 102515 = DSM 9628]
MKIGLGAVQFGLDYGIANTAGKVSEAEVAAILAAADALQVGVIDTAALYGDSEAVLGRAMAPDARFDIVTKTPQFAGPVLDASAAQQLEDSVLASLSKLRRAAVYGVLIHRVDDLFLPGGEVLMERLVLLKARGLVGKIGVSVYTGEQIDQVLARFPIDLIQLPINVLDQRLLQSGHLRKLKLAGVEIHARSVFLQGLLLMPPQEIPDYFNGVRERLYAYHRFIATQGLTPLQAALGFVAGLTQIDRLICGVNSSQQLQEICAAAIAGASDGDSADYAAFAIDDETIVNPALWHSAKGKK